MKVLQDFCLPLSSSYILLWIDLQASEVISHTLLMWWIYSYNSYMQISLGFPVPSHVCLCGRLLWAWGQLADYHMLWIGIITLLPIFGRYVESYGWSIPEKHSSPHLESNAEDKMQILLNTSICRYALQSIPANDECHLKNWEHDQQIHFQRIVHKI